MIHRQLGVPLALGSQRFAVCRELVEAGPHAATSMEVVYEMATSRSIAI
jgi:hypothetical protein